MSVFNDINKVIEEALKDITAVNNLHDIQLLKNKYLGKQSTINSFMKQMKDLSPEDKPKLGQAVNKAKEEINNKLNSRKEEINTELINKQLESEKIDITLPGTSFNVGKVHPITKIIEEVEDFFIGLGYEIKEGPEVEIDEYNFEKLNLPKNHPARDMQDSFYIDASTLLRTHTSPVQVRTMLEENTSDIKIICPGRVYRRDAEDATHSHQFHQIEGLVLGTNITFANLKGTLLALSKFLFGEKTDIRLRPSYFPFTEPSVEVDVTCFKCKGKGCNICKGTGWIEILGAGMVNNNVLEMCGIDSTKTQGFAFGVGVERIAMIKYSIDDIRNFFINYQKFTRQFI